MGNNRKTDCNIKLRLTSNKGIALITTIILVAAILIISGAMLYLITRGIRSSGEFQRYETVQAASEGGMQTAIYILENFEDIFYKLEQKNQGFYGQNNASLEMEGTNYNDDITFNRLDECIIDNDNNSENGAYLDRYLIGMKPSDSHYVSCQEQTMSNPFITIIPNKENGYEPPYNKIDIYIRKDYQGSAPGAGGSASLSAPSSESGGSISTAGYLLFIRSFATHYKTNENSTVEMLYYLLK